MDTLTQLEAGVERLIQQNKTLVDENRRLNQDKVVWAEEKSQLISEIDRILERINLLSSEAS